MAAWKKKSLPLRHLTDTFINQREQMLKKSHLQERWQELKERELNAQQNNRQLLQQFDEAQDTLREMITLTADMTTIRMEYERYLEESYPRWQQQLERKTQSAQRQNREEQVSKSSADRPFNSKGPTSMSQQMAAPPNHYSQNLHMDYNQHGSPHLPYMQTSWQPPTQFQRARFPIRAQHQPQGYSHVPPSFPQHPDPYHHQHLDSPPGYHHSRQDAPGWAPLQPEPPWPLAAGAAGISACSEALWGPLYREEPPPEIKVAEEEVDTSLAPSSKREGGSGGRSSHFSQELDIKPVRLSGGPAESSESSRESSQGSREKKRGTSQKASLDSCSSHESSESSSAIVIAAATAAQNSESDASSEKSKSSTSRRKRRGGGLAVGSPSAEKPGEGSKGENSGSHREESRSTSAELGSLIEEARIEKGEETKQENQRRKEIQTTASSPHSKTDLKR
ncbi:Reticulocyte-binding protein 2 like a [Dissostichus eleginoides]|uniref:Centrosomal protein kizuna n=1 Tax=Dissostichus eleginoides TaxID=100907 RepID=A0AAD9FG91_DISEL|nr:Reticulocyte-binding protein 2 like a [Dissostichus eleginoides]